MTGESGEAKGSASLSRTGVADYFAILGVGDRLTWKHTQKQQHIGVVEEGGDLAAATTTTPEDEEEAEQEERFFREIVEVSVFAVDAGSSQHSREPSSGELSSAAAATAAATENSNQSASSSTQAPPQDVPTSLSCQTESSQDRSTGSAAAIKSFSSSLSPSNSEATTTVPAPSAVPRPAAVISAQQDGWNLVQKTLPAAAAGYSIISEDDEETTAKAVVSTGPPLWDKFAVWDANLDWSDGLRGEILARQEAVATAEKKQPLTGLRRKMKSTLKHFNLSVRNKHENVENPKFYLAFQRRQCRDRPAIADLQLLYVRLHRTSLPKQAVAPPVQPLSGLAGQILERYQSQAKLPEMEDETKLVPLEDYLTLPDGFEEWSIPDEYRMMKAPQPSSRPTTPQPRGTAKTVLFAHDDSTEEAQAGIEAIETISDASSVDPETLLPKLIMHGIPESDASDEEHFYYIPVLAVRRQRLGVEERYHEDTAIVDLAVTFLDMQGAPVMPDDHHDDEDEEEEDEGTFRLLGKTKWAQVAMPSTCTRTGEPPRRERRRFGSPQILVRRNLAFGFADAAFATRVLGRFPFRNYEGLPLPEEELPMFCYPTGCRLHRARFSDAPLAQYYGFVVKNERGDSIYVSCVSFMEPLTSEKVNQLARMSCKRRRHSLAHRHFCERRERKRTKSLSGSHNDSLASDDSTEADSNFILTGFDDMTTFENKTICLVSRYPFWTAFRKFLSHLHILSGSSSELPLERWISHLLLSVPLPKPGGPNVLVPLPALNDPMILMLPPEKDFPLVDLPYQRLFACLEIKTIVTTVLGLLALERKVIVMSTRPSLVLDVCELLRSLLFPFELCAPYVPRLTEPFKTSLDFPGAIFVGIHDDGSDYGLAAIVRKTLPEDSVIIDLDTGDVDCDGDRYEVVTKTWEIIPESARSMLVSELETLCRDAGIVDGQEPLDSQYDSAFHVALPSAVEDFEVTGVCSREPLDDRAIRDAFLRFFCAVLGGYERFLVVPDADFLISGNEWFDAQGFLASVAAEKAPYLNSLVSTQLFQSFIQRRTEASDVHCLLFDECLAEYHSSAVPYGRLGGDVEEVPSAGSSQPQMLYSLLVDQSAALPSSYDPPSIVPNGSMDASEAESSINPPKSTTTDASTKYSESAINIAGDLVTAPSRQDLPGGKRFIYCIDGNPCFPHHFRAAMFLPREPGSWLIEMPKAPNPLLARSERELEEANRRRRLATTYRGLQNQRRCLWQLPKLMGSHFLGSWLLCIPAQVSQSHLSDEHQSRYLLRALGALRVLRSKQRIVPDEAAYRALMVACGRTRSDRRVELVKLFGLLRSDSIFPSAVTLGQYTRGLAEGYSKRSSGAVQEDDCGGIEVTESTSKVGRSSSASLSLKGSMDFESSLNAMDGNLTNLETHGRRWRQRSAAERYVGQRGENNEADQKKKRGSRLWLPVVFSSSFVPDSDNTKVARDVRLVALWSRTQRCSNCAYVPLEEEVQAGWDVVGGENDVPGSVACPRCGSFIVPMLGIKDMSIEEACKNEWSAADQIPSVDAVADFGQLPPQISPSIEMESLGQNVSYVTYISPAALRLSLEQYVEQHGEEVLERRRLRELDPEVFYNFWWYCARFSLPFPLPVAQSGMQQPVNYCAFAAWDRSAAERGCFSAAKTLSPLLVPRDYPIDRNTFSSEDALQLEYDESPLLSRFNLQGFYSSVWDHADLSKILVTLVEACDKRDFKPVIESVLRSNQRRREEYGLVPNDSSSDINEAADTGELSPSVELDVYRTILYLAKYQCTTAFHAFFPATVKPCKGYHYWCATGVPLPMFDRLLRDGVRRINKSKEHTLVAPIRDVSDVALGFRCVFGHLI